MIAVLLLVGCGEGTRVSTDTNGDLRPTASTPTSSSSTTSPNATTEPSTSTVIPQIPTSITLIPLPEPPSGLGVSTGALDDEGTFTMTVTESNDPQFPVGESASGLAYIEAYKVSHGVYHGQLVFEGLKSPWMYRNALEFQTTESSIELSMLAIPVTYVTNAHPCGDRWEEVYTTTISGGGDWETLNVEMKIKRDVRHISVKGCGAPDEAIYRHRVRFVIH